MSVKKLIHDLELKTIKKDHQIWFSLTARWSSGFSTVLWNNQLIKTSFGSKKINHNLT